jgi:hypothetical protein
MLLQPFAPELSQAGEVYQLGTPVEVYDSSTPDEHIATYKAVMARVCK